MNSDDFSIDPEAPDTPFDVSLRPPLFEEFCGQERTIERLQLLVEAAGGKVEVNPRPDNPDKISILASNGVVDLNVD